MSTATPHLECPDWCVQQENGIHCAGEDDLTVQHGRGIFRHYGPEFGDYVSSGGEVDIATGHAEMFVLLSVPDDTADPEVLRSMSDGAARAADWLEAHR